MTLDGRPWVRFASPFARRVKPYLSGEVRPRLQDSLAEDLQNGHLELERVGTYDFPVVAVGKRFALLGGLRAALL